MTVREFLFKSRMKHIELATKAGIDPARLSKFLNGWLGVTDEQAARIAAVLGVTAQEIKSNAINKEEYHEKK